MRSVALALILCALLPLFHAYCYRKAMTSDPGKTHCRDDKDKTWHPVGSRWRNSDCMDCDCLECCQGYMTPVDFPGDCMKEWDQKACKFKVWEGVGVLDSPETEQSPEGPSTGGSSPLN
uniref:Beta-microseminoprotein-like n=1 Tax=Salmo trutta TaxID=8032 RepID=A0A674F0U1_SALTR